MTTGNAGLELRGVTKVFGGGLPSTRTSPSPSMTYRCRSRLTSPVSPLLQAESGSGKTTIARLLMGIVEPTSGEVLYNGKNVAKMSRSERTEYRREIQPIFQDPFEVYNPFYKIDHIFTTPRFEIQTGRVETRGPGINPKEHLNRWAFGRMRLLDDSPINSAAASDNGPWWPGRSC